MTECCLLMICCDPAARHEKAVEYYAGLGFGKSDAMKLAADTLRMVDSLLALTPARIAAMRESKS
ncbi:MAG: hypothetical protein ACKVQA_07050 [Burkholderiales bacterium]